MQTTPQGNEILDFEPNNLPPEYLAAIGLLVATSSQTESMMAMAIAGMLGLDDEQGWAVTAHMPAPLRASVLRSSAEIRLTDAEALDELDVLLEAIKTAQAGRNDLVHGSWCQSPQKDVVFVVKEEARTHVEVQLQPVTVDHIKLKAAAICEAGYGLVAFMTKHDLFPDLPRVRVRGINTPQARKNRRKANSKKSGG